MMPFGSGGHDDDHDYDYDNDHDNDYDNEEGREEGREWVSRPYPALFMNDDFKGESRR
jgi:hypothetical protein